MRMSGDITDLNPNIHDSTLYMVNDLIFTSAGIMMRDPHVKVEVEERDEWEHGDNVTW